MRSSFTKLGIVVLFCMLLFSAAGAWAQAGSSTIRGTLTDPSGAVVAGARITITDVKTNYSRSTTSGSSGSYSFELIPPGEYKVDIEAKGFRRFEVSLVQALIGSIAEVSVKLEIGEVSSIVEVEASAAVIQVNTQNATLGNAFDSSQLTQLPSEGRNVLSLLTLQPGVTPDGYVSGARSDQSNITLDGVDINEAQTNDIGSPVLRLNSEAIEEFRVTTVNATANEGRSSGAQINLVTKSGTNNIHGSLFEYHRNTIFTANDFFNNRSGVARPKLLRNTFGGTIGGPVVKDKLFFFYSYEGRHDASGTTASNIVPLPLLAQGQVFAQAVRTNIASGVSEPVQSFTLTTAQLNNSIFNVAGLNPVAIAALQAAATKYPANDTSIGDSVMTSGFRFNASTPVRLNSNVAKLDWNINSKMTAFARLSTYYDHTGQVPRFPDTPAPNLWEHPWGLVVSHSWTIGRNWVNSFRYGLTREAFSQLGDSTDNSIYFRFVFLPRAFTRTLSRTTPVDNIVDDASWIHGNHTLNFGTNIRLIRNRRVGFANAFDLAITNPSFYQGGGKVVSNPVLAYIKANLLMETPGTKVTLVNQTDIQNGATALIGRYSEYTADFTFGASGALLDPGTPTQRTFATEQYDVYVQDSWKLRRNLTLNLGLRYGIGSPVHELGGFGVLTDISASELLRRRIAGAATGTPYNDPLTLLKAGGDGKGSLYNWDKKNFQPRISVAWSPNYSQGLLHSLFGDSGKSVIRSGFAMTNDYYGQALAVAFDLNNTLGFTSNFTTPANTYNVTDKLGPLFTGFNQQVRPLPGIVVPGAVTFPRQQPSNNKRRIEDGVDSELVAPTNYQFSLTFERQLGAGLLFQSSYVGRLGRHLLATRDVMALNNLRDLKSGLDWYTAATVLEKFRQISAIDPTVTLANGSMPNVAPYIAAFNQAIPPGSPADKYFSNIFPADLGSRYFNCCSVGNVPALTPAQAALFVAYDQGWGNDWTDTQDQLENAAGTGLFFHPQYGALTAWGTIANSQYHALLLSIRQRVHNLQWDFNYTFSHSQDDASGLQTSTGFGTAFIENALRQGDSYANSDFDLRHIINVNAIYQLPFGRGKFLGGNMNRGLDAIVGGWQLSGIYRWNSGLPVPAPYDDVRWATNWNAQSNTTQIKPVGTCPTRGNANAAPKLFGCNTVAAYQSFRNAYPGETGQRNTFRFPSYVVLDMGLSKSINMPWSEKQKIQLRWEVFNVTNTQHFGTIDTSRSGFGMGDNVILNSTTPPSNWSNFTVIQGTPRVMQIGARFEF